jgi:hypothetical protein
MYVRSTARTIACGLLAVASLVRTGESFAQENHQHDMAAMAPPGGIPATREGSGTSWQPDESPMYAIHRPAGSWMLMLHGAAFLQYLDDSGERGADQFGSINWIMGMAQRKASGGQLAFRGMLSAEPWTIRGCGYPDLLATGEACEGQAIHDRQHPHDLFMELAAEYSRPLGGGVNLQLYGGPAGEPALGPVAFMHRVSAPGLLAPITHHWLDSTHITYGVATAGIYGSRWKAEGSLFNGREPDETRTNFDFAAMDSWSGRFWLLPSSHVALQVSAGHLTEAEMPHEGGPRVDLDRVTASAMFHRTTLENTMWATTLAWGRNAEDGGDATHALMAESSVTLRDRDAIYGRAEWSHKSGHDLVVEPSHEIFTVAKLQAGYTRCLAARNGWSAGIGAAVSLGIVPDTLKAAYGQRFNTGGGVYLTLRPGAQER